MKKNFKHILIAFLAVTGTIIAIGTPHVAHAGITDLGLSFVSGLINFTGSLVAKGMFFLGNYVLSFSGFLLYLSGTLLNAALNETIHISTLVTNVTAIDLTWRVVRDFSSIFLIFMLLYGSIATILGLEGNLAPKKLIANIVIWGILMNFSLFFTKVIIDASNVVTLTFYNAIAPDNVNNGGVSADGGISNIFAQQLRVVTQWDPRGSQNASKGDFEKKAGPAMWLGSAVMFIAAGSFFVVSLMLIIRIAILIVLMAFSPIYFISKILPKTEKLGGKWMDTLVGQVMFAPAYLAIIYVVMKIVSSPAFGAMIMGNDKNPSFSQAFIDGGAPGVVMNYIIVIVLLNTALVVAKQFGDKSYEYATDVVKRLKPLQPKIFGKQFGGFLGRHTLGRGAKSIMESDTVRDYAAKHSSTGLFINKQLGKVAGATFGGAKGGYKKAFDDKVKARAEFAKKSLGQDKDLIKKAEEEKKNYETNLALKKEAHANLLKVTGNPNSKHVQDLKAEIEDLEKAKSIFEGGIKKAKEKRQTDFADSLERGWNPLTKKSRLAAAKKIREELNKGKEKKLLDEIKEFAKGDEGDKEEKGGEGKKEGKKDEGH